MLKSILNRLRVIGKPLTVHTEMIVDDEVWKEIKKKVNANKVHKWYLITPHNFDIFQSFFKLKMTQEEFEKILIKRYKWLVKENQDIGLHVHLSKNMKNMTYDEQETLIKRSLIWLENKTEFVISDVVPGWWSYNEDTEKILKKLDMTLVKRCDYKSCHDYDWIKLK
jgi:peptidoglycan/xylan/chitin deacetylase (PgdA/CDA1 family)